MVYGTGDIGARVGETTVELVRGCAREGDKGGERENDMGER